MKYFLQITNENHEDPLVLGEDESERRVKEFYKIMNSIEKLNEGMIYHSSYNNNNEVHLNLRK